MRNTLLGALLFFAPALHAQVTAPTIILVGSAPSGSCSSNLPDRQVASTGALYSCQNGTWAQIGGSAGATLPFPGLVYATSAAGGTVATAAQVSALVTGAINPSSTGAMTQGTGAFSTLSATASIYTNASYSLGTVTTSVTINPANGNHQNITLTAADTAAMTFTQPSSGTATVTIKITQSASGGFNGGISGCKWPGGVVPAITQTTGAVDFITAYLDGTTAYCVASQNFQ